MSFQLCQCRAQSGYAHAFDCPYPYFGHDPHAVARWTEERAKVRARLDEELRRDEEAPAEAAKP